ncbi:MAG TPA: MBL fold metallo-hydrolase [Segeticoccus sp.]|nr:MBL fold metallo-hydrolase [Segeticoccus sp.]
MDAWVEQLVVPRAEVATGDAAAANVWVVGDAQECAVVDPLGDMAGIRAVVGERRVRFILCTHVHPEHVSGAIDLAEATGALIFLHGDEFPFWARHRPDRRPDVEVVEGLTVDVGRTRVAAIHTPGHTPGSTCWHGLDLDAVFTGHTLGADGPHVAGRAFDIEEQVASIRGRLFSLRNQTVVHPGVGPDTRISTQRWDVEFWR